MSSLSPLSTESPTIRNISEKCYGADPPDAYWSAAFSVTVATITAILLIIGLFSNSLVIVLLFIERHLRTTAALLLANVALVELLYFLLVVPVSLSSVARGGVWSGTVPCQINGFHTVACASAVWQGHAVIAAERYAKVVHPYRSYFTRKQSIVIVSTTWAVSVGIALIPVFSSRGYFVVKSRVMCGPDFSDYKSTFLVLFFIVLFLPLAILVCCFLAARTGATGWTLEPRVYRVARRLRHQIRKTYHCYELKDWELGGKSTGSTGISSSSSSHQLPVYPTERDPKSGGVNNQRLKEDIYLTIASFQSSILYFIVFVLGMLVEVAMHQISPMDAMSCHLERSPAFYPSVSLGGSRFCCQSICVHESKQANEGRASQKDLLSD